MWVDVNYLVIKTRPCVGPYLTLTAIRHDYLFIRCFNESITRIYFSIFSFIYHDILLKHKLFYQHFWIMYCDEVIFTVMLNNQLIISCTQYPALFTVLRPYVSIVELRDYMNSKNNINLYEHVTVHRFILKSCFKGTRMWPESTTFHRGSRWSGQRNNASSKEIRNK